MEFTLDFYFRQYWEDNRLQFTEEQEEICIGNEMLDMVWWPDTFFVSAKSANFQSVTTKNAYIRIKPNGLLTFSLRLTVTSTCLMDLTYFPMDTQICSLVIESYAYSDQHISYNWKAGLKGSVKVGKNVQLPQVKVHGYRVGYGLEIGTANYSQLNCEFYFVRSIGYYIIQIYFPCTLIVVLSWISFWLHRDAAPARVALGITTILTMTTFISSTNSSLPKISYLKSIDVYLVTCFVMVFAAIVEFAIVSYIANVHTEVMSEPETRLRRKQAPETGESGNQTTDFDSLTLCTMGSVTSGPASSMSKSFQHHAIQVTDEKDSISWRYPDNIILAIAIDRYSRILFPVSFGTFSALYWVIYTRISPVAVDSDFVLIE